MRSKTELKEVAKDALMASVATAYYSVTDGDRYELTEEEEQIVLDLIRKYGTAMAKAIGERYYTL